MNDATSHWKLGLLVLLGIGLTLLALVLLGVTRLARSSVEHHSYFDEAVTGLDNGSPVRFRGVTVGRVTHIDIAPDQRHVEVRYELEAALARELGGGGMPRDLRAQLAITGVTGMKYLLLDFFEPSEHPVPTLGFAPAGRHIPATRSTLRRMEQSVTRALERFSGVAADARQVLFQLASLLADVDAQRLPERAVGTLDRIDQTLDALRTELQALDARGLSRDARRTLAALEVTVRDVQPVLHRLSAEDGVLASVQRASDMLGDLARNTRELGPTAQASLDEVREAAAALREVLHALALEPDMLVKGRRQVRR